MLASALYVPRVVAVAVADALCLVAAAALAWLIWGSPLPPGRYALAIGSAAFAGFVTLYYGGAYGLSVVGSVRRTLVCIGAAMGMACAVVLVVHLAVRLPESAIRAVTRLAGLYLPLLLIERFCFRQLYSLPRLRKRVLVIGVNELGISIAKAISQRSDTGVELVGFLYDEGVPDRIEVEGVRVRGSAHEVEKTIDLFHIGAIIVASNQREAVFPADALLAAKLAGCHVESGVAFYERITGRVYLSGLRQSYLIFSDGFRVGRFSAALKRMVDVWVAALGLVIASPILGLCALAIRLDSSGPVFYRQDRVGKEGRLFRVRKLRTMRDRAEEATGPVLSGAADHRVTRVGRILRATRLDEIPQLWNVLRGDMSLVGPRPERPELREELCRLYPYFRWRSSVAPGLTGWAQIRRGYVSDLAGFEEKLGFDLYYLKHRSLRLDLFILWKTLKTVALLRGV